MEYILKQVVYVCLLVGVITGTNVYVHAMLNIMRNWRDEND